MAATRKTHKRGRKKGFKMSAAHKKAISEALKKYHRSGKKRKNKRSAHGKVMHKRSIGRKLRNDHRKMRVVRAKKRNVKRRKAA